MKIRSAELKDAAGIARVHVDSWRSTYPGLLPEEVLQTLSYAEREESWGDILSRGEKGSANLVLEDDSGKIVGFASVGAARGQAFGYDGELYAIYLQKEAQGRGWGRALFRKSCQEASRLGYTRLMLWVLEGNPTRGFYEAQGGKYLGQREDLVRGEKVQEVAYGWQL